MVEFRYEALRRFPDVEAENLRAWDATDVLLAERALRTDADPARTAVIGDGYGAVTLRLAAEGWRGIRVHQDLVTGRRALQANARMLGLEDSFAAHALDADLLRDARLVLLQLPRSLAELAEIADAVARWAAPDVVLVAGGRVKHMTVAMNDVLAERFAVVQPQRGERKSRLVIASEPRAVPEVPPFPVCARSSELDLVLCAHGGVFAGERLDIGTRALLDQRDRMPDAGCVVDLGCGNGVLAIAYAKRHKQAQVVATDRSAAAVRSTRASIAANGLQGRVRVTLDDAGSDLPTGQADLVLLNPPFHLGASVHSEAARRLIRAAARLTRPGGEVWTVFNSHLDHRRILTSAVGETEQVARNAKFTVTRSVRRGGVSPMITVPQR